jgi:hypothetical protein
MNLARFLTQSLVSAVTLLGMSAAANAASVQIGGFSLITGAGYGADANEVSGTRLGLTFSTGEFVPQNFTLTQAGDVGQFALGLVTFMEPDAHGGLKAAELDGLEIDATLAVSAPFASSLNFAGAVSATTGAVSDAASDFVITWDPIQVAFGNGGLISVALNNLVFHDQSAMALNATVTLLRGEQLLAPAFAVPEPAGALLFGAALLGVGALRRRRP